MIVEALIGGATVCFVASLSFARFALKRVDVAEETIFEKQRKVLEKEYRDVKASEGYSGDKLARMREISNQLVALAAKEREP